MLAVVRTGGKQYRVSNGDKIQVERLNAKEGDDVVLDEVLFVEDGKDGIIGDPLVQGVVVTTKVIRNYKDKKVIVFKKRRRQNSRRKNGHRQCKTELRVLDIKLPASSGKAVKISDTTDVKKPLNVKKDISEAKSSDTKSV